MDDVVFLPGGELRHGHHHAITLGEGLIHAEGIVPVLKFPFVEFESDGNGAFLLFGAVTGDAELVVDLAATFEGIGVPVVDEVVVVGDFEGLDPSCVEGEAFGFFERDGG